MAQHYRKMIVNGDHINAASGPPWTILWDTAARTDAQWSTARMQTEAGAIERAAHFLKLGFVVHAIKDPTGTLFMDADSITTRFAGGKYAPPQAAPDRRSMPSAEQSARNILRGFSDDRQAVAGLMVAAATLHARVLPPVSSGEFDRAVEFARDSGWLSIDNGTLMLTEAGRALVASLPAGSASSMTHG